MNVFKTVGAKITRVAKKFKEGENRLYLAGISMPAVIATANPTLPANILNAIDNIAKAAQGIGAALLIIFLIAAAWPFMMGDREHFQVGKTKIIGIIVGAALLFSAGMLRTYIKNVFGYTSGVLS